MTVHEVPWTRDGNGSMVADIDHTFGVHDRVESEEDEALGRAALAEALGYCEVLNARIAALQVLPGSALDGDGRSTPYARVGDLARNHYATSIDHLFTLRSALQGEFVTPLGSYTLVRASIEAVAMASWLLAPASRDDRVLRALQTIREGRQDLSNLAVELGGVDERRERVEARLQELRDARPGLRGRSLGIPAMTRRVQYAAQVVPAFGYNIAQAWRLTSGLAHGRHAVVRQILDHRQTSGWDDGVATYEMTINLSLLGSLTRMTVQSLGVSIGFFDRLNNPPRVPPWAPPQTGGVNGSSCSLR